MPDLLSDVLRDLRLASAVLSLGEYLAPWGIHKEAVAGAPFHVIVEGQCLLGVTGGAPIDLSAGDLVVLPHGSAHTLMSDALAPLTPFARVLADNGVNAAAPLGAAGLPRLRLGTAGPATRILNGLFTFHDARRNPLLPALPSLIHVRGRLGRPAPWLERTLGLLLDEVDAGNPGFQTICERAADIIFVQAVRAAVASEAGNGRGWLRGLADPHLSQALALVHDRPHENWTLEGLARTVGLSRTVFANRFREHIGATVMDYVTARRMHVATGLLAGSTESIAWIASRVGYQSEVSFSKAFRRQHGVPPGQYRRAARQEASGLAAGAAAPRAQQRPDQPQAR